MPHGPFTLKDIPANQIDMVESMMLAGDPPPTTMARAEQSGGLWTLNMVFPPELLPGAEAPAAVVAAAAAPVAAPTPAMPPVGTFPSPRDAIALCIKTWEGLWQNSPSDSGNYAHCTNGSTRLVGTMRGVTPDAYADFNHMDPCEVTPEMLQGDVTLDVAADIAMQNYFKRYRFNTLLWCPLVDIAFDAGFLSGPGRAVSMLQQLIGAKVDGGIGPQTAEALELFVEGTDIAEACDRFADLRIEFYKSISQPGTKNAQFRQGWINRANWARPSNKVWWSRWAGWTMPHPAGSSKPTGIVPVA
ncbi:MAG TPA: putative peptidoglycan-binding domain-containing protein [Acetobacteraceae bacterium]|jgi:lysozyme family protein